MSLIEIPSPDLQSDLESANNTRDCSTYSAQRALKVITDTSMRLFEGLAPANITPPSPKSTPAISPVYKDPELTISGRSGELTVILNGGRFLRISRTPADTQRLHSTDKTWLLLRSATTTDPTHHRRIEVVKTKKEDDEKPTYDILAADYAKKGACIKTVELSYAQQEPFALLIAEAIDEACHIATNILAERV